MCLIGSVFFGVRKIVLKVAIVNAELLRWQVFLQKSESLVYNNNDNYMTTTAIIIHFILQG